MPVWAWAILIWFFVSIFVVPAFLWVAYRGKMRDD